TADSLAPAIMATASPRRLVSKASPTACAPEAQAEVMAKLGPRAPTAIEICPAAMSAIIIGTVKGLTRSGPRSTSTWCASSLCCRPPLPPGARPSRLDLLPGLPGRLAERGEHPGPGDDDAGAVHHSAVGAPPQRRQLAAQAAPVPQETKRTSVPDRTRPSRTASKSAIRG